MKLLGAVPSPPEGTRPARIVVVETAGPFQTALLDRGRADGIVPGGAVVGRGGPARPGRRGGGARRPGPAPLRPDRGHGDPPPADRPRRRRARRRRLGRDPPVRSRHRRRRGGRRGRHLGHGRDLPARPPRREDRRREAPGLLPLPRASRRGRGGPDARNARLRLPARPARRARARVRLPAPGATGAMTAVLGVALAALGTLLLGVLRLPHPPDLFFLPVARGVPAGTRDPGDAHGTPRRPRPGRARRRRSGSSA